MTVYECQFILPQDENNSEVSTVSAGYIEARCTLQELREIDVQFYIRVTGEKLAFSSDAYGVLP